MCFCCKIQYKHLCSFGKRRSLEDLGEVLGTCLWYAGIKLYGVNQVSSQVLYNVSSGRLAYFVALF
jgi:hypothetical protein